MANLDFTFAWEDAAGPSGPWSHLLVVQLRGHEEMGAPRRYELYLIAKAPASVVAAAEIIDKRATLRIATLSTPAYKVVHGVVTAAREVAAYPDGMLLHVTLTSAIERARHRRRSRVFLNKTTRQIIDAVLGGDVALSLLPGGEVEDDQGDPSFAPAEGCYTWRVADTSRLDDPRARGFCVQYNESDLDFVTRLLEAEGIGYHIEDGAGRSLLVLADRDAGRTPLEPPLCGPGVMSREVSHFYLGARMRSDRVIFDDYNWKKPALELTAAAGAGELVEYDYPGGYPDSPGQGAPLAQARRERLSTEASRAHGDGAVRVLSAGSMFQLEHPRPRCEGAYLVTALRVEGEQQGVAQLPGFTFSSVPFHAAMECARRGYGKDVAESRFRPARRVPWPRIVGTQTATVTAEPASSAEVDVGGPDGLSIGCVRVKFPWDVDVARHAKEPTSCWVRVSQVFAGAGQGAVWHPRVGVEVVVAFEEGDPDRPLVVGRVYNGKDLPPYGGSPVHSTFKSFSTPGGGTWNEVTFNDAAGGELVYLHAGKDMTAVVRHDRLEQVGGDARMTVAVDNTETVGANETISIGVNETLKVGVDDTLKVAANSSTGVGANDTLTVSGSQTRTIASSQTITVGGSLTETVTGAVSETVVGARETTVTSAVTETLDATRGVTVTGSNTQGYHGGQVLLDWASRKIEVGSTLTKTVNGSAARFIGAAHQTNVTGTVTSNVDGAMVYLTTTYARTAPNGSALDNNALKLTGLSVSLVGLAASATGIGISLTGASFTLTGIEIEKPSIHLHVIAARLYGMSIQVCMSVFWVHLKAFTCLL